MKKSWVTLAQKLFITSEHAHLSEESKSIIVELLDHVLLQDKIIEDLESRIKRTLVALQEPLDAGRYKR